MTIDAEEKKLRKRLQEIQEIKRNRRRAKRKKVRSETRGRRRIDPAKIALAKKLAKDFPIPDVADRLGISLSSLYAYGVKRYLLNMEEIAAKKGEAR